MISNVIVSLFILLFIYTATSKIFTFRDFDNVLHAVPIFGPFHLIIAVAIIGAEIIIGALLIIPLTKKAGLYATLAILIIFTVYLTYMVSFETRLPCSCGGILTQLSWKDHIWLNTLLVILAGFGILTNPYIKQQL